MQIAISWAAFALSALLTFGYASAQTQELPDIGTPANSVLTLDDEYQIGRMVVKGLRDAGQILEDPEITEYLQSVGGRLVSHTQNGGTKFQFFAVKSPEINAFALPGGFIGVNTGLLMATANESELAGVLAHEIAHVTQRHIARSLKAQSRSGLVSAAAMLAAILIAATTGASGDAMMGAIAIGQGAAAQQQLNFTRANESEADRLGIATLASSGFNPSGMPDFFETLARQSGMAPGQIPELLQSHPYTSNRIAEARDRARDFPVAKGADTIGYKLSVAHLRVLSVPESADPVSYYEKITTGKNTTDDPYRYGRALALMTANKPGEAIPILKKLVERHDTVIQYRTALGQAQMQADQKEESLATFARALDLFPRNIPLTVRYAEALMRADQARKAHQILLDLFNTVPPTPEQARFIALCANTAGDVADAYYYMSEYHIMSGELLLAINQLKLALAVPNLTEVQKARFQSRMDEIREYLPKNAERMAERSPQGEGEERKRQ